MLNATLDNGTILTRDGFTTGNSYDVNAHYTSSNIAGYLSDEWKMGKLRLDGGVRVERTKLNTVFENSSTGDLDGNPLTAYNNNAAYLNGTYTVAGYHKTQVSWTAGADYAFTSRLNGFVRANGGALLPQFDDLRGNLGSLDDIKPQTVKQYEVGLKTSTPFYDLYLTGFYNRFHNLFFQDIQIVNGQEQNVTAFGGSRAYGARVRWRRAAGARVRNRNSRRGPERQVQGFRRQHRQRREPAAASFHGRGHAVLHVRHRLGPGAVVRHLHACRQSLSPIDENLQQLGSYNTLDLGASIDINQRFSIQATVENVTNTLALTEGNIRTVDRWQHATAISSAGRSSVATRR